MAKVKIPVDNGHGFNTDGKRSPDGKFLEYAYNREIAAKVVEGLRKLGYDAELLVPETYDVSLEERVNRVNTLCKKHGKSNVILLSIHVNAAKNGQWSTARGWSCYTSRGQTKSDIIAELLYKAAEKNFVGHKIRTEKIDGDKDIEQGFYLLKNTLCPAVLTENFFMDNKEDLAYILSDEGKAAIVKTHIDGLVSYLKEEKV
jgi:N-acetylmuramoyl-L-alanine amidase